jgi:hypothetical protein
MCRKLRYLIFYQFAVQVALAAALIAALLR